MADSFRPDSFEEDRPLSAAGTPLPRTIEEMRATVPSIPIELPAQSEQQGPDSFVADSFTPDTPPAEPAPGAQEGFAKGALMAAPRRVGEAYETLKSAGEPGISVPRRAGRVGMAALQGLSTVTAPGEFVGGAITEKVLPEGPGVVTQPHAPAGHPWAQVGLAQEESRAARRGVGELFGGATGPYGMYRAIKGGLPGRAAAGGVTLPPPTPKPPRALPEIPDPVMATDAPVQRTLQAASEQARGRALDLGEVGRKRMAAIKEREASYRPEAEAPKGAPAVPEAGTETAKAAQESQKFMDTVREAVAYTKTKLEVPNIAGFPPSDVAKGVPAAERLVSKVQKRASLSDSIHADLVREVQDIYKGLDDAAIKRVNQALDSEAGSVALSSAEQAAYGRARAMFDNLADAMGMEPGQKIVDYFPRLRELVSVSEKKMVKGLPTYLTQTTNPKIVKRWFEKERKLGQSATDMTLDPVLAYVRGASKNIAYAGGKHPSTGENIPSILQDIEPEMARVPGSLVDYFTTYVNDMTGVPRRIAPEGISPEVASTIKSVQFARTIGLNPLSPVVNTMQQALTFSEVNVKNFAAAYKDLFKLKNPKEVEKLRRAGIIDALGPSEHDFLSAQGKGLPGFAQRTASKTGQLFQATEKVNRAHAYYAGLREAADRGLKGDAAEQFAQDIVRKTQFLFGKEDLPQSFRAPLSEHPIAATAQVSMRQFKNFPIKYTMALKNMVADDLKNLPEFAKRLVTDPKNALEVLPSKTTKFAGLTAGLFGSDAITAGFDRSLMGDDRWWQTPGLIGYLGMSFGHQAGLGAIPIEDLRSVMFFLPGPAIAMFLDGVSAGLSIYFNKDIDVTTTAGDKHLLANLRTLPEMDPDKTANQITRAIPIAGISLNRVRQGLVHYRAEEPSQVRRPQTLPQAFGVSSVPASAPIKREATTPSQVGESIKIGLGFPSARVTETSKLREQIANQAKVEGDMARRIAELMIGGQEDEARRLMESSGIMISPEALRAAMDRAVMEPALVQALRSKRMHRGPAIEKYRALPGGYGMEP